jgi:hypothetical protein
MPFSEVKWLVIVELSSFAIVPSMLLRIVLAELGPLDFRCGLNHVDQGRGSPSPKSTTMPYSTLEIWLAWHPALRQSEIELLAFSSKQPISLCQNTMCFTKSQNDNVAAAVDFPSGLLIVLLVIDTFIVLLSGC